MLDVAQEIYALLFTVRFRVEHWSGKCADSPPLHRCGIPMPRHLGETAHFVYAFLCRCR